jgi:hypothetical protein
MYDARTRDRFRALVGALTGVAAVAAATGAGALTGLVSQQANATDTSASGAGVTTRKVVHPRVVRWKRLPHHTIVSTHTVYRSVPSGSAAPGGGSVSGTSSGTSGYSSGTSSYSSGGSTVSSGGASGGSSSSGGGGGGAPAPAPAPKPAPKPAPAPSSGS